MVDPRTTGLTHGRAPRADVSACCGTIIEGRTTIGAARYRHRDEKSDNVVTSRRSCSRTVRASRDRRRRNRGVHTCSSATGRNSRPKPRRGR